MNDAHQNSQILVLTGGGTAGHVMPNLALVPELRSAGFEIHYIGSAGVEKELAGKAGLSFHQIASGKLRRYFSFENLVDVFKVILGVWQAFWVLLKLRPVAIFSKGGFVAVPVAFAGRILRIPVVSHESDYTPGLANRIIAKFARRLLYSFPETAAFVPKDRSQCVPSPIRRELFEGERQKGIQLCGFDENSALPIILVMGGSQGAQRLNDILLQVLPELVKTYRVIHLTGRGKQIDFKYPHYCAFEFLGEELRHIFSIVDMAICRAGANSIFEMLALRIPMLLVPLEAGSRGDQVLNAKSFVNHGWAQMVSETSLTPASLMKAIAELAERRSEIRTAQDAVPVKNGGLEIVNIIRAVAK